MEQQPRLSARSPKSWASSSRKKTMIQLPEANPSSLCKQAIVLSKDRLRQQNGCMISCLHELKPWVMSDHSFHSYLGYLITTCNGSPEILLLVSPSELYSSPRAWHMPYWQICLLSLDYTPLSWDPSRTGSLVHLKIYLSAQWLSCLQWWEPWWQM